MAHADDPLAGLGYADVMASRPMVRIGDGAHSTAFTPVAEEVPVAFVYNGRSHVVVMATPADLEDLAYGFSLTEAIITDVDQMERVDVVKASHGIELQMQIANDRAAMLEERARGMVARTGCGLCGVASIGDALGVPTPVGNRLHVAEAALWRGASELATRQSINHETNSVHGAAWVSQHGEPLFVREDVGRHNALDKLLGAIARDGRMESSGFVVVTSRASYEMVQKVASRGVELLAAISRPTGLAIRFAEASGMTLVGLLRGTNANVYTHSSRIATP
jgi:FdhD protein